MSELPESKAHKRAKKKLPGKKEVRIKGGRRVDSATKNTAYEVERSGTYEGIRKAVRRLRDSGKPRRVLIVPQKDMDLAAKIMREEGVSGTVSNIGRTKKRRVVSRRKKRKKK